MAQNMSSGRSLIQSQMYPAPPFNSFQQSYMNNEYENPFNPVGYAPLMINPFSLMLFLTCGSQYQSMNNYLPRPPMESLPPSRHDDMIHGQVAYNTSFHTGHPQHVLPQPTLAMGSTYPLSTGPIDGPVEHSHPFTNSTTDSITCSMNNLHHFEAYPHAQSTQSQVPIEISFPRQGSVPNTRLEYQPGPRSRISPDICTEIPFERQNNSSNGLFSAIAQNAPCCKCHLMLKDLVANLHQ